MKRSTERNRKCSALLRLPGEIRNRIYEYIFGGNMILLDGGAVSQPLERYPASQSNLLSLCAPTLLCRDIYNDTLSHIQQNFPKIEKVYICI
jgi:hypothetical protein